jgi:hypothetical protein
VFLPRLSTIRQFFIPPIDISENECRDVALLRLYKGFRQRIINFWRCPMVEEEERVTADCVIIK